MDERKDQGMTQSSKKPRQRPRVITPTHRHHAPSTRPVPLGRPNSTGQSLATFRGRWAGDDRDERLAEVYQMRGQVVSDYWHGVTTRQTLQMGRASATDTA